MLIRPSNHKNHPNIYFVSVDPAKVSHLSLVPESSPAISGPNAYCGTFKGLFDQIKLPFERHFMFETVQQILNGEDWESTLYFKRLCKKKSGKKALTHLEKLDRIIHNLSNKGYLSQYQLGRMHLRRKVSDWEVPQHEMLIGMDRYGQLFRINNGKHRLAVAQNIGLQKIPAILTLYHEDAEHLLPTKRREINGSVDDFRPFEENYVHEMD